MKTYYTNGTKTIKIDEEVELVPEGFYKGAHWKGRAPWNKGLTKETDTRVRNNTENSVKTRKEKGYTPWNKGLTKETDSRIKGMPGELNPMFGKHPEAWNKNITRYDDERMLKASENHKGCVPWNKGKSIEGHPQSDETREKIRNAHLDPIFQYNRYLKMKKNGTLSVHSDTSAELKVYNYLLSILDKEDIEKQFFDSDRYPFKCDFYIKSLDLFIEVHGCWTHGDRPFNKTNEECVNQLNSWKIKAENSDYYRNAIYTWTVLDVRKRNIAKENQLNYIEIFDVDKFVKSGKLGELLENLKKK